MTEIKPHAVAETADHRAAQDLLDRWAAAIVANDADALCDLGPQPSSARRSLTIDRPPTRTTTTERQT